MRTDFIVSLSLLWFRIKASKANSEHKPAGGVRGKAAGAESNAANDSDSQRIYGGNETIPHEFPYHLMMIKRGFVNCGAVIIDLEWAVTAGHCGASTSDVTEFAIFAGKHDKSIPESTEQNVSVVKFIRHESYSYVSPPFQFNEYVQKVLPQRNDEKYSTGTVTAVGWGETETTGARNVTKLRKVSLPLMTNERCLELYKTEKPGSIYTDHICAGGVKGKDSCVGDSGGPLLIMEDGRQVLIGLTSWGRGCGRENLTGVYTRVTEFLDWMENRTGLDLYGRAEGPISVGETSRSPSRDTEKDVRAKISNSLAQAICKSYDDYAKEKNLAPAFKTRPKTPEKCGWASWSKCQDSGEL